MQSCNTDTSDDRRPVFLKNRRFMAHHLTFSEPASQPASQGQLAAGSSRSQRSSRQQKRLLALLADERKAKTTSSGCSLHVWQPRECVCAYVIHCIYAFLPRLFKVASVAVIMQGHDARNDRERIQIKNLRIGTDGHSVRIEIRLTAVFGCVGASCACPVRVAPTII
jgi:hypothetical protein